MGPKGIFRKARKEKRNVLTVSEALEVIKKYEIPVAEYKLVKKVEDAIEFANKIGYPVVLKVVSPQLIHKIDVGGVFLDIESKSELQEAFRQAENNLRKIPNVSIHGFLVQKMISDGVEMIIGGKHDQQFGPFILTGMGGVLVEVYEDLSIRFPPITKEDALEMLKELKGYKILKGYRGRPLADLDELSGIIVKLGELMLKEKAIREIDVNPVIVLHKGASAVDARIVLEG
ncbi:MAG: acetate--CoA ligase family protein [Candidatus Aenigmarchaeota archaeon]|nr:acetate--CoA ligase family protein [Candidatus Aenigmarchaeota archaeon]